MCDSLKQYSIQRFRFAPIFTYIFDFSSVSHGAIQDLRIAVELIQKLSNLFWVTYQSIPPLLRQLVFPFICAVHFFDSLKLDLQYFRLDIPHQLADKLHLASFGLVLFIRNSPVECKCFSNRLRWKINFCVLAFGQFSQFLAERLQRKHFSFFCTFRRNAWAVIVEPLIIYKGAFISHVCEV